MPCILVGGCNASLTFYTLDDAQLNEQNVCLFAMYSRRILYQYHSPTKMALNTTGLKVLDQKARFHLNVDYGRLIIAFDLALRHPD